MFRTLAAELAAEAATAPGQPPARRLVDGQVIALTEHRVHDERQHTEPQATF